MYITKWSVRLRRLITYVTASMKGWLATNPDRKLPTSQKTDGLGDVIVFWPSSVM
jgi:hypothetical protein